MPSETREKSRFYLQPEWWLGGPFLFFGAIILLCGLFRSADELYIRAAGERTEATVCQVIRKYSQGRRSAWVYTPVFRFTDTQGQSHTIPRILATTATHNDIGGEGNHDRNRNATSLLIMIQSLMSSYTK